MAGLKYGLTFFFALIVNLISIISGVSGDMWKDTFLCPC